MSEETVQQLRSKLESQTIEFENYKAECKKLEEFLEEESGKKEDEIRKLKEEAIKKEKNYGQLKSQVGTLEAENTALKAQLAQLKEQQANVKPVEDKSPQFLQQIEQLNREKEKMVAEFEAYKAEKAKEQANTKNAKPAQNDGDRKKLEQALSASKSKVAHLEKQIQKLKDELSKKPSVKQIKVVEEKKVERDTKQQQRLRQKIDKLEKRLAQSQSDCQKQESNANKLAKQVKELKAKVSALESERQHLQRKVKQISALNSAKKQQKQQEQHEQHEEIKQSMIRQDQPVVQSAEGNSISALIMTKKHYASPFMEFKNNNQIRLYKSTKNGCFEKSLGLIKFKLANITHDSDGLLEGCAERIKDNFDSGIKSTVIFYGPKKSTKKYLLAALFCKLKQYLLERIEEAGQQIEALFVNASSDPEKRQEVSGHNKQEIEAIIDRIIEKGQKSPKKTDPKKKVPSKPKARYFRLAIGDRYLEIITTSFTNVPLRQSQPLTDALNNIAYSRLPNALQPTDSHKQIILTVNPIVSLYDECRNTLSICLCRKTAVAASIDEEEWRDLTPNKEELNDATRKKLESIERESEQNVLRMRRQQEEIGYYRGKFDELEVRLKNLLNTHREHNKYLKKSPITLSYEKMLKFVHSVQSRGSNSGVSLSASKIQEGQAAGDDDYDNTEPVYEGDQDQHEGDEHAEEVL